MAILNTPAEQKRLLERAKTIAVVGLSPDPTRDSHGISAYMKEAGYRVIGINPKAPEILGEKAYPSLSAMPDDERMRVDLVNVFRRPDDAQEIVKAVAAAGVKAVWFQPGTASPAAIDDASRAGLDVVSESCVMVAHRVLHPRRA